MASVNISIEEFKNLINRRAQRLLCAVVYLSENPQQDILTRPLLGDLLSQSTQVEEFLDSYGARNNQHWSCFRSLVAAIKLFSNVSYELLHIEHSLPNYQLLPLEEDFEKAIDRALEFTSDILIRTSNHIIQRCRYLGLRIPELAPCIDMYNEQLPQGRLDQDLATRSIETVAKTVTLVATAFLNLAASSKPSLPSGRIKPKEYQSYISGPVTEEKLRSVEFQFHNLQSLYDTFVSKTETEGLDRDLPVLRGHISVVLHLLRTATDFVHYYERHINRKIQPEEPCAVDLVDAEKLLSKLMNFSVHFAGQYLASAEVLCREMLKRYIEIGKIEVKVPQYRGFHVRPSTLVSKLVLHYGSAVQMEMDGEVYDASSPLELFRANEKINAQKRKHLAQEIVNQRLIPKKLPEDKDINSIIHEIIMSLAKKNKIILYERPLILDDKDHSGNTGLIEEVTREIAKLMATGKIDIVARLKTVFRGDKRVLEDIKLLADTGYGEDNFGNNIALPDGLSYLRKS